jgi:hypothetical protein
MRSGLLALMMGAAGAVPWLVRAQEGPLDRDEGKPVEFAFPELATLELFVGPWNVTETHFDTKGKIVATVKGTEEIAWLLDRHAIRRTYATSTGDRTFKASGILTWNAVEKKYHGVWFDNASTAGPSTVKGTWDRDTLTMLFDMESSGPLGPVRHRAVEKFDGPEKRVVTTYQIDGSSLIKRLEVEYHRAKPCPSQLRGYFGG